MKIGVVAASVGGVSAVGGYYFWGGYRYFSSSKDTPISIREALKDYTLISSLFGESLTKQWVEEFRSAKDDIKREIKELKDVTQEDDGGRKLGEWCSEQMELDSKKNVDTLALVKKYCLIRDLASQLRRKGKTLLEKGQSSQWSAAYKRQKNATSTRADVGLENTIWPAEDKESEELLVIQTWCEETSKGDFLASDNDDKYNKLIKWCTETGQ